MASTQKSSRARYAGRRVRGRPMRPPGTGDAATHCAPGRRDAALIHLAYDSMCRASELLALAWQDFAINYEGHGSAIIRRSKTDKEGRGRRAMLTPPEEPHLLVRVELGGRQVRLRVGEDGGRERRRRRRRHQGSVGADDGADGVNGVSRPRSRRRWMSCELKVPTRCARDADAKDRGRQKETSCALRF